MKLQNSHRGTETQRRRGSAKAAQAPCVCVSLWLSCAYLCMAPDAGRGATEAK